MFTVEQIAAYLRRHKGRFPIETLRSQLLKQGLAPRDVDEAVALAEKPFEPSAPPPGRSYILVVDDDPLVRDLIVAKLEGAGYRVTSAADAAQSVLQAEGLKLALIISDIEMPGFGTGVDALQKLRASASVRKDLPVIFVTGLPSYAVDKLLPATDPYVRLIHKPVDWKLLRAFIKELTGLDNPFE